MQATDAGRRAKRDDYSIRSPEPELSVFLSSSIYIIFVGFVASTLEFTRPPSLYIYISSTD